VGFVVWCLAGFFFFEFGVLVFLLFAWAVWCVSFCFLWRKVGIALFLCVPKGSTCCPSHFITLDCCVLDCLS
jgi:hypothetical protein